MNGLPVPILFVSADQINAQMPFQAIGDVTLILRTPGGQSDNFNLVIEPNAPSVFWEGAGRKPISPPWFGTTTTNWSRRPIRFTAGRIRRSGDYLTGLGPTSPAKWARPAGACSGCVAVPADSHPGAG